MTEVTVTFLQFLYATIANGFYQSSFIVRFAHSSLPEQQSYSVLTPQTPASIASCIWSITAVLTFYQISNIRMLHCDVVITYNKIAKFNVFVGVITPILDDPRVVIDNLKTTRG